MIIESKYQLKLRKMTIFCFFLQELNYERYKGPLYVAEYLSSHLKGDLNAKILDVAAGTGIMTEHVSSFNIQYILLKIYWITILLYIHYMTHFMPYFCRLF